MLCKSSEVESSVCNRVYVCACCGVGPLQSCCCYSYHQSQEQIAFQNKHSHFRLMGGNGRTDAVGLDSFFYPLRNACFCCCFWKVDPSEEGKKKHVSVCLPRCAASSTQRHEESRSEVDVMTDRFIICNSFNILNFP